MVKYNHHYLKTKNPCILYLSNKNYIDIYLIDKYLELISPNNFFKKLFKNTEVFFLTIAYYSTVDLFRYRYSSTHAKEILV